MKKLSDLAFPLITFLFLISSICLISLNFESPQVISLQAIAGQNNNNSIDSEITSEGKININTASAKTLTLLNGIGEVLAQRIIDYREEHGPYSKISDLLNVKGIGEVKLSNITAYIAVE